MFESGSEPESKIRSVGSRLWRAVGYFKSTEFSEAALISSSWYLSENTSIYFAIFSLFEGG